MRPSRLAIVGAAALAFGLGAVAPAPADISVDVSPAKYELQTQPGKTETFPIQVRNTSSAPVHIVATLSDYLVGETGNYTFLAPGKSPYSLTREISINPREFDVDPGTSQQVRFSVTVPATAKGEYNSLVFFTTRPTRKQQGIAVSERIASKIYVLIPESSQLAGAVDSISAKAFLDGEHYLVGFRNTGNVHEYLSGRVEIRQGSQVVERIPFSQGLLVERGGKRLIDAGGKKLPPGSYSAVALIDYGGPNLVAGQTTFTVR